MTMDLKDDSDLQLMRASPQLLTDFRLQLQKALGAKQYIRDSRVSRLISLIDPFQEDPQLLDRHLPQIVPDLVNRFLECVQYGHIKSKSGACTVQNTVAQLLYYLCKIRGEKVIVSFFNNEPQYLEPMLGALEACRNNPSATWHERYILLLWLSHLMLAPFDLSSISSDDPTIHFEPVDFELPQELPSITRRIIPLCVKYLRSPTKESGASARLLSRICLRPDMRKAGLLDAVVTWAVGFFGADRAQEAHKEHDVHACLGMLTFISRLIASGTVQEIGIQISRLFSVCQAILDSQSLKFLSSLAITRKLIVKTFRIIVLHCLRAEDSLTGLDVTATLEDVIGFLLEALSDGDAPVRFASSKAISVITFSLDQDMAVELIEAVIGGFEDNVLWEGHKRSVTAVNSLRWHGLTLTLSHLLYKRAPPPTQLPDVLNALLLALNFEQRSATGTSVGSNVRDAANFGIWALSRRYTTEELTRIDTSTIRAASSSTHHLSVLQMLAVELVISACLDPAGNIRRGSSAALQELVGRHPDTVMEGISVVQTIDFQAVGLHQRAMIQVGSAAGKLSELYWDGLFTGLVDWRGTGSNDEKSREIAALALGSLAKVKGKEVRKGMLDEVLEILAKLKPRQIEEKHGLLLAFSSILECSLRGTGPPTERRPQAVEGLSHFAEYLALPSRLKFTEIDFSSPALRPRLTAIAVISLVKILSLLRSWLSTNTSDSGDMLIELFNHCLHRNDEGVLRAIPEAAKQLCHSLPESELIRLVGSWHAKVKSEHAMSNPSSGYMLAIGSSLQDLHMSPQVWTSMFETLLEAAHPPRKIDQRVIALRALNTYISPDLVPRVRAEPQLFARLQETLLKSFNDYTVTSQGDVGSLVRLEALPIFASIWSSDIALGTHSESEEGNMEIQLYASLLRLSLEKLDKLRSRARTLVSRPRLYYAAIDDRPELMEKDVSSESYFRSYILFMECDVHPSIRRAVLEGMISSAAQGSDAVERTARIALAKALGIESTFPRETAEGRLDDFSVLEFFDLFLSTLNDNLGNPRLLPSILEILAFLLDMRLLHRLITPPGASDKSKSSDPTTTAPAFSFRRLLSLVQKAHHKSPQPALHLTALSIYRNLAEVPVIRELVLQKVVTMLRHPAAVVRTGAAEVLWMVFDDDGLGSSNAVEAMKQIDWGRRPAEVVEERSAITDMLMGAVLG
ncbi:hypothetical protein P152DRAFT_426157 [Eremomyces bilateralis CBS 781.70]|uniref:Tubulin-specific chaperone D C-terminal domain-containing protein n=1 Tax=Eremomyces bilateralis CBS 781.70 TaxID=1392243 RepID=A0A6G1GFR1_9PEZI|nr:uncharacterized protein P152DRAFT_426157 [Eremomyces bilateralis CBS 781.70]KAF1816832.1 hypothetical protein P152DRAFT_426157 [Eremomyces bilateralis CBS 781.70]